MKGLQQQHSHKKVAHNNLQHLQVQSYGYTGSGGGTIGTGAVPTPNEQGFTGVPRDSGQASNQQTQTPSEQQPPMGSVQ